jgi:hypothetical protein
MIAPQHVKLMKTVELLDHPTEAFEVAVAPGESEYTLNIEGVYQDSVTRNWAVQTCHRATRLAGEERVQNTWHNTNSLSDPGILLNAVRAAVAADVIVISVYAADELPLDLYVWIEAWLPRRLSRRGALAALVGVAEPLDSPSVRTLEYLQAVARKAQLDFIPQQRDRPAASVGCSVNLITESASTAAQSLQELYGHRCDAYRHWGLNEKMDKLVACQTCGLVQEVDDVGTCRWRVLAR